MAVSSKDRTPHLFATDWYEDITDEVASEARQLGSGGIAMNPPTKLFDVLAAIQIGAEKVDTGSPAEFKILSEELAAASAEFPLASDESCSTFMDRLIETEMAWHDGSSSLQTVISCLMVEDELHKLSSAKLGLLSAAPLESASLLDLSVSKYLDEYSGVTDPANAQTETPTEALESLMKVFCWSVIKAIGTCMELSENHGSPAVFPEEDLHPARYDLYFLEDTPMQHIIELTEKAKKRASKLGFKQVAERLGLRVSWLTVLKQGVPKKHANLDRLVSLIENWQPKINDDDNNNKCSAWFTAGCQTRLNMACLRQQPTYLGPVEAKKFWLKIVNAIKEAAGVFSCQRSVDLLGCYLTFSSRREPAIVRAMVKSLSSATEVLSQSAMQWTLMDINETIPPPGFTLGANKNLSLFLSQASLCYTDLITVFCQNRCRMREGLSALVISFDSLQVAADELDRLVSASGEETLLTTTDGAKVSAMYFSSWTYFRKLQIMLWTVLLTFEIDVLNYNEIAYTNWYASQLCQNLLSQLSRMRAAFEQHGHNARDSPGFSYLVALELESQMLLLLCTAQYMLWIALHKLRPPVPNPNVSLEMQFQLRFSAFGTVGMPQPLKLDEFTELGNKLDVTTALQGAATSAQSARTLLSSLSKLAGENAEIPLLQRSAVGISVAVAKLVKLGHEPINVSVTQDGFHWYFPVPNVSKQEPTK